MFESRLEKAPDLARKEDAGEERQSILCVRLYVTRCLILSLNNWVKLVVWEKG